MRTKSLSFASSVCVGVCVTHLEHFLRCVAIFIAYPEAQRAPSWANVISVAQRIYYYQFFHFLRTPWMPKYTYIYTHALRCQPWLRESGIRHMALEGERERERGSERAATAYAAVGQAIEWIRNFDDCWHLACLPLPCLPHSFLPPPANCRAVVAFQWASAKKKKNKAHSRALI